MDIKSRLHEFYKENGIAVDAFDCRHRADCDCAARASKEARGGPYRGLYNGSEAHVGDCYGDPFKLVVVSMDRGDGSQDVWHRTQSIQGLGISGLNKHMAGTLSTLRLLLPGIGEGQELWKHFAMTNLAKCCYVGKGMGHVPTRLYANCGRFGIAELEVLDPDLVVIQGSLCRNQLRRLLRPLRPEQLDWLGTPDKPGDDAEIIAGSPREIAEEYLGYVSVGSRRVPWVYSVHPSARKGEWQDYRANILPIAVEIARYLASEKTPSAR